MLPETSLTPAAIAALAVIMTTGALVPGVSVLVVSARSASLGFSHGVLATLGIMVGDILFILIALFGLSILADIMGSRFDLIRYPAGLCLIWLGIVLWRAGPAAAGDRGGDSQSGLASFVTGLLVTLGDQKAILFYLGFFPAFLDLTTLSVMDAGIIVLIAIAAVGGPKLLYAWMAGRAGHLFAHNRAGRIINVVAGGLLVCVGIYLIAKA